MQTNTELELLLLLFLRAKRVATLLQLVVGALCRTIVVYLESGRAMDDFSACSVTISYLISGSPLREQRLRAWAHGRSRFLDAQPILVLASEYVDTEILIYYLSIAY